MSFTNNYFKRLFRANKALFVIVVLFALITIAFNFILKEEVTPFIKWDLYSEAIPSQEKYIVTEVRYNDNKLLNIKPTWMAPEKALFTSPLDLYLAIKNNNNEDPLKKYYTQTWKPKHPFINKFLPTLKIFNDTGEIDSFPKWYQRYLSQYTKEKIYRIDVFEKAVTFDEQGNIVELSSSLICRLL
jgi:hypothetical protein